jgi:hypothetical protein
VELAAFVALAATAARTPHVPLRVGRKRNVAVPVAPTVTLVRLTTLHRPATCRETMNVTTGRAAVGVETDSGRTVAVNVVAVPTPTTIGRVTLAGRSTTR